jgi:hypothetical protein
MTTITITQTFTSKTRNGGGGGAIPPSNTVAPVISGTPTVGQTLSSTTGTWTGNPTPTYTYQWKRNGSNIASATSSTYTLVQADATFAITCAVTGTNVAGAAEATSNSLAIVDADAQAFITAAGITDNTQKTAINTLVVDMKGYGIWTKMKAIYPFVGGTATTHKWNLKDPQDTDAAYRLVFNGGWTHSSTGALPNGTNGYADTKFNVNLFNANINSYSLGVYLNSILISARNHFGTSGGSSNQIVELRASSTSTKIGSLESSLVSLSKTGLNTTTHQGFWAISKRATNDRAMICADGTFIYNTGAGSIAQNSNIIFLAARNANGTPAQYDTMSHAFDFFADGLNDTELINLRTAVITFQTTLGRQV